MADLRFKTYSILAKAILLNGCSGDGIGFSGVDVGGGTFKGDTKTEEVVVAPSSSDAIVVNPSEEAAEALESEGLVESQDVVDLCSQLTQKTVVQTLSFPAISECAFGEGENLGRVNGRIQAVSQQFSQIELPGTEALVCGLSMTSQSSQLQYDDLLVMTLESFVIMSSNRSFFSRLSQKEGLYFWEFESVRGMAVDFDADPYCLGANSGCEIPETDTFGQLAVQYFPEDFAILSAKLSGRETLMVSLVATGDNDNGDCMHSDFSMTYAVSYVDLAVGDE
ncbi:hypothetical protein [Pseudobacteriovorax antillogorgiicola]|uniref:Uncharacterized protein n=1 Tax=Pseudobacteriovorax antillogorgiicola TaxID=1513793 RepID=A0A1Y6CL24_9BACT|nr:hypothetical protein [Pseudobacteriovorax antillogorgiicola]TCS45440.1 hypothetical protein EDD56_12851 [Pseudobacteriovorax antillogorgiicola]SMF74533.1 hypothetical protein SAMN06296036_12851 [Pseudobacteriovorax antillogorgiicola]